MQLVDLSMLIENTASEPMRIDIKRCGWYSGAKRFCKTIKWNKHLPFRLRIKQWWSYMRHQKRLVPTDFPGSAFLSLDEITMPTHMGTHIDAPFHFGPSSTHDCKTIDQLPLDWFYQPGVRLDMRHKKPGSYITVDDIKIALQKIEHKLSPLEIVLIWTGVDELWGTKQYFSNAPGMSSEATKWIIDQGIKVIGIDAYSFDRPFGAMLNDFWSTGDNKHLWPAHFLGRETEYAHIERLANLGELPPKTFMVSCFPVKIKGVDAGWSRVVGMVD